MGEAALLALLWLFGRSKKSTKPSGGYYDEKPTSIATTAATVKEAVKAGAMTFDDLWQIRTGKLLPRAASGARWVSPLEKAGLSTDAATAAARWIGIESGGNPLVKSGLNERGLAQSMRGSGTFTDAEWAAMIDPKTSADTHVKLAIRTITTAVKGTTGKTELTAQSIGLGKLYHGLPLMVRELREQGLLKSTVRDTLQLMVIEYKPSAKVASYVKGTHALTGKPAQDCALRFVGPAAVVAYGDGARLITQGIGV